MKKLFVKFLVDSNNYQAFISNIEEQRGISFDEYWDSFVLQEKLFGILEFDQLIASAFNWRTSKEKYNYWEKVSEIWRTFAPVLN